MDIIRMIFFLFAVGVIIIMYVYIGRRLVHPLVISPFWKKFLWRTLLFFLALSFTPFLFWAFRPETPWMDVLLRIVFFQFGLFSILFPLLLMRDAVLTMIRIAKNVLGRTFVQKHKSQPLTDLEKMTDRLMSRRAFLTNAGSAGIFGFTSTLTGLGLANALQLPEVKRIFVDSDRLPREFDGFKIVQISDLHVGPSIKRSYVEKTVQIANSLNADIAVLTGDMVDGSVNYLSGDMEPIGGLKTKSGIFFCTGNHEYYSGVDQWIEEFRRMGVIPLVNENAILRRGKSSLSVSGVTDIREGKKTAGHASDPLAAMRNIPDEAYKILLAHQPGSIFEASRLGYDLQLSGHTHGGQYFPYNFLVDFFHPYSSGLHLHDKTHIYVNTATGYWGPPQRMGRPGEITLITLHRS